VSVLDESAAAFGIGVALGVSPGPVQAVLLTESARGGLRRGFLAMVGANGAFLVLLLLTAAGVALAAPGGTALRLLKAAGGAFLLYAAATTARDALRAEDAGDDVGARRAGPATRGVLAVVLNPGAWLFLGTTASALTADAARQGGRALAFLVSAALMVGVSLTDALVVVLGGSGSLFTGRTGLAIRLVLAAGLAAIGVLLLVEAVLG
jgi:threonine/homoserine/homoserine lactone efflux protein